MPYGPLLTRQYGPNPKGSKLSISEMDDNLLYLSESIAASGGGGSIYKLTSQTLASGSWVTSSGYYTYAFTNANINTNTRVDFTPDTASYLEVTTCGLQSQVNVTSGTSSFFSLFPPQSNITGEITIFPTV